GEAYIDGVDAGQTPLAEYVVKPGRHTVRIEHPGFKTVSETVQVDASNTVRKRYSLLPECLPCRATVARSCASQVSPSRRWGPGRRCRTPPCGARSKPTTTSSIA